MLAAFIIASLFNLSIDRQQDIQPYEYVLVVIHTRTYIKKLILQDLKLIHWILPIVKIGTKEFDSKENNKYYLSEHFVNLIGFIQLIICE